MTQNEKNFCSAIALLAKKMKITPGEALCCFGVIAAGMVVHRIKDGADRQVAIDTATALFTDNVHGALAAFDGPRPPHH